MIRALSKSLALLLTLGAALVGSNAYSATYAYDYSGNRYAGLLECDKLHWTGERVAADSCFATLHATLSAAGDSAYLRAEAQWALGDIKTANSLFGQALVAEPENPHVLTRWGYLYLQTFQYSDAAGLFQEALDIDPNYQPARIGFAAASTDQFAGGGFDALFDILEDNVDSIESLLILSKIYLEQRDVYGALPYLEEANNILTEDFSPLKLYAYFAAAEYILGNDPSEWINKAIAINPNDGDLYVHMAYFAEVTYQYRDAADFLQEAARIDPYNWKAQADLGLALAKLDQVESSRQHLEAAYAGDPYNLASVNMLRLFDTFGDFIIIERSIPYRTNDGDFKADIRLRVHRDEAPILGPYVFDLLSTALPIFVERYDFHPVEPIVIELYPNHDDFAVRTLGEPMIGPLGITFGYLFAMDSPSAKPAGQFHWGSVFWHELSHVFSLEASGSRVPRWFSEGLSTYEEWNSGPANHYQIPHYVFEAMSEDLFLPVRDLDSGFLRPSYENQVIVSYNQAGLVCDFIGSKWGPEIFSEMLLAFKNRATTDEVFDQVLEINSFAFDRQFRDYVDGLFGDISSRYKEWAALNNNLSVYAASEDWPKVIETANQSLIMYADYTESDSVYEPLARAYRELEDFDNELIVLENYVDRGGYSPRAMQRLAELLKEQDRLLNRHEVLQSLRWVSPFDEELHSNLAASYSNFRDSENAILEYNILLDTDAQDIASAHLGIAELHLEEGRTELARRHTLMALEAAPYFRDAQNLLFQITQQDN
jgi:tetratricopeptide (TPR) repeat protein